MAIHYFGSWKKAVKKAGFNYSDIASKYDGEEVLFKIIRSVVGRCKVECHKTFDWLKNEKNMHVDFYIPKYNLAIELQGRQHYEPVDFAGRGMKWAKNELQKIQIRDKKKKNLLRRHGIKLIEIKYDDPPTKEFVSKLLNRKLKGVQNENI